MAISYVQSAFSNAQGASVAFPSNNTAGNCLIVAVRAANGAGTPSLSDTRGNTYTLLENHNPGTGTEWSHCWIAPNCLGGANTVNAATGTGVPLLMAVLEYSGIVAASPVDASNLTGGTSSVTTTASGDLLFMALGDTGDNHSPPQAGTYTSRQGGFGNYGGTYRALSVYDTVAGAAGSYSNGLINGGTGYSFASVFLLALKAAATQRGNIDYDQIRLSARQGTGSKFQMSTGSATSGHVLIYDSNGNAIDSGASAPSLWSSFTPTPFSGDAGVTVTVANVYTNQYRVESNLCEVQFYFNGVSVNNNSGKIVFTLPIAAAANGFISGSPYNIAGNACAVDYLSSSTSMYEGAWVQVNAGAATANIWFNKGVQLVPGGGQPGYVIKGSLRYPIHA